MLSRAGLYRRTRYAFGTLVVAANAPDVDIFVSGLGAYTTLALRRGLTHGPLALLVLPLLVAGGVLAFHHLLTWLRTRYPRLGRSVSNADPPLHAGSILLLSCIGVLSHPALDWLNTYGIRLLSPFSGKWFYGDAVFIIDPWLWLLLAAALYMSYPRSAIRNTAFALLMAVLSLPVIFLPMVPPAAKLVWCAGIIIGAIVRVPDSARTLGAAAAVYVAAMITLSTAGERIAHRAASEAGVSGIVEVMYAPVPANPFRGELVIATDSSYRFGTLSWLASERVTLLPGPLPRGDWDAAPVRVALTDSDVSDFLVWSRFPYVSSEPDSAGSWVSFGDARYRGGPSRGGLTGLRVFVNYDSARVLVSPDHRSDSSSAHPLPAVSSGH